jgi:acyl-CoA thioesterase-1
VGVLSKVVALLALALSACRESATPQAEAARPTGASPSDDRPVILCLGTSLTAGYGLDPEQAYPALVQRRIDEAGLSYRVVNAGVSGETSAGALQRIDWLLQRPVAVLVLETGANDGLRGLDVEALRSNLQALLERAARQQPPPRVLLAGMRTLTNYGRDYGRSFRGVYPELAARHGAALVPFLLEGVAGVPALNLPDGIHPNAEGQRRVAETVWTTLHPLL